MSKRMRAGTLIIRAYLSQVVHIEVKREQYYSQVFSPMPGYFSLCLFCTISSGAISLVVVFELCSACFSTEFS
jgi:hypothetical protein